MNNRKKTLRTVGELMKSPEYQARLRALDERLARNAEEYQQLQAPLLDELASVGKHPNNQGWAFNTRSILSLAAS